MMHLARKTNLGDYFWRNSEKQNEFKALNITHLMTYGILCNIRGKLNGRWSMSKDESETPTGITYYTWQKCVPSATFQLSTFNSSLLPPGSQVAHRQTTRTSVDSPQYSQSPPLRRPHRISTFQSAFLSSGSINQRHQASQGQHSAFILRNA